MVQIGARQVRDGRLQLRETEEDLRDVSREVTYKTSARVWLSETR